jgi:hypothetical protein
MPIPPKRHRRQKQRGLGGCNSPQGVWTLGCPQPSRPALKRNPLFQESNRIHIYYLNRYIYEVLTMFYASPMNSDVGRSTYVICFEPRLGRRVFNLPIPGIGNLLLRLRESETAPFPIYTSDREQLSRGRQGNQIFRGCIAWASRMVRNVLIVQSTGVDMGHRYLVGCR